MEFLRPAERAALHVSVSQIKTFLMCPKKYEARYVLGWEPEHKSPNLVLGSAVHEALAEYYSVVKAGAHPLPEAVRTVFEEAFYKAAAEGPGVLLDEGETLGTLKEQGLALLGVFLEQAKMPKEVVAVEHPFAADIIDPDTGEVLEEQLVGAIDAIVQEEDRTVVLEHKTAARAWSQDQLDYDMQVSLYQAVIDADVVRLQVMTKTKVPRLLGHDLVRTEAAQVEAVTIITKVLTAVRAGAFWSAPGWQCKDCEYRRRCRGA